MRKETYIKFLSPHYVIPDEEEKEEFLSNLADEDIKRFNEFLEQRGDSHFKMIANYIEFLEDRLEKINRVMRAMPFDLEELLK